MEYKFSNKEEMIAALNEIAQLSDGREYLVCLSLSRYRARVNDHRGISLSLMVDEFMLLEETMAKDEYRYIGQFYVAV